MLPDIGVNMVKLIFTRKHVNGHVSVGSAVFISREKAVAAVATWNTNLWSYVIVSVKPCNAPVAGYVASNGQII